MSWRIVTWSREEGRGTVECEHFADVPFDRAAATIDDFRVGDEVDVKMAPSAVPGELCIIAIAPIAARSKAPPMGDAPTPARMTPEGTSTSFIARLPETLRSIVEGWKLREGASPGAIARVQIELGVRFPEDLIAFYRESNGASGSLGETFLELEPVENIAGRGDDYDFAEFVPQLVLFGTNGGSEGFAVDKRSGDIVVVPLHEPRNDDIVIQGSFRALLERVAANTQFGD